MRQTLLPWEAEAILQASRAYVGERNAASWDPPDPDEQEIPALKLGSAFRALANAVNK